MRHLPNLLAGMTLACWLGGCSEQTLESPTTAGSVEPTETAEEFVARVNAEAAELRLESATANWTYVTYINKDTALLNTLASERYSGWHGRTVKASKRYDGQDLGPETRRALERLRLGTTLPAPSDPAKRKELISIQVEMKGMYGAKKFCRSSGDCLSGAELESLMEQSRDFDELLEFWQGWRTISPPMRDMYRRYVELANEGARELGYTDLGAMWRSKYDMGEVEFRAETERLWKQVEPLYAALHCHVRAALGAYYGEDKVPQDGPIPAQLLGNMWAQEWSFIYDLLEPFPGVDDLDVDSTLKTEGYSPQKMVRSAESFYVSLGLPRLPDTFWERSIFTKPADRDIVCHASASTIDSEDDLRIKMCIEPTYDKLRTIYHELGHNYYQWAYKNQPLLFQGGANGGFHEAVGDAVTLSMTPRYLAAIGLVGFASQSDEAVINRQMQMALDKIAFLPFGKMLDEWRWAVFSGETPSEDYNAAWWDLRERYQGVAAPVTRTEADFDPGAKYHVPANVSYTRYFVARILQFQFHRALCAAAGHDGPLHECSVFGSKEAGERLWAMLEAGASEPWQDTLEKLTGTREMDATAIIDYFAPLLGWLGEQNQERSCGW